ncbi:circadian clock protein KaiA [Synechocystis sp. LKSZ1]|uniref:circadian clock protein KaiA n=1 Tax=Synechocystis sp. LKSZ1 TaxID=3144951 RepID=UPI00336C276A
MQSPLYLCLFIPDAIAQQVLVHLQGNRYRLTRFSDLKEFMTFLSNYTEHVDCLIVVNDSPARPFFNQLYEQGRLLPIIILESQNTSPFPPDATESTTILYHYAEIHLPESQWAHLPAVIDQAITHYLHLGPSCALPRNHPPPQGSQALDSEQSFLLLQQRRLADKLKERLGYLGVYYKRNPNYFYRNLSTSDRKEFLQQMGVEYREIILNYFAKDFDINQLIDQFVNKAFFADISVSQILEIHMELMDEFSQHLKLEGRSEEILLDYRLALIDILAHLGEMYRRSIPREDIPFDVYYQTD